MASAPKPALPYYLDPAEGCGLLAAPLFPDPVALVERYVAADHAGAFLASTPLMDSVYVCPAHLPGPDEFSIVAASRVHVLSRSDSAARVLVESPLVGGMFSDSVGLTFEQRTGVVADTFVVLKTPYGWRIESPQLPDRVYAATILEHPERFALRAFVRDSLAKAARAQ